MNHVQFTKFESAVRSYAGDPCDQSLLMASDGPLEVYYSPFEWVNEGAKLVLVGITPGRVQAANALAEAKRQLIGGADASQALKSAKETGAFSGPMRKNLVAMLDHIGVPSWLGVESSAVLFDGKQASLLQTASVLQFPVFLKGGNYNGTPDILTTPLLRQMLLDNFAAMARTLSGAAFVPLGPVPLKALRWLASSGQINASRILEGLPHPSPANVERVNYFLELKDRKDLSSKTDPLKLDAARSSLRQAVVELV